MPVTTILKRMMVAALVLLGDPAGAGDFEARYRLTFEADWSAGSHPQDFPPSPHFSALVGVTHDGSGRLWRVGELASEGIENMAETGSTGALRNEILALIDLGAADTIVTGGGIAVSPGEVSVEFDLRQSHSLVSVVSMLAPSPDWFVGTDSVNLRAEGMWRDELAVDLFVYDAGTDSGTRYTSPNSNSDPAEPIRLLSESPFDNGTAVGRFRFQLLSTDGDQPPSGFHSGLYFDPARDGEGINVNIARIGERRVLSVTWYTYDLGQPLYLVGNVDIDGAETEVQLPLFATSGAMFGDQFQSEDVDLSPWGSAVLRFPTCATLELDYDGGSAFGSGQLNLQQLVPIEGLDCP